MKVSESWLRKWVNPGVERKNLLHRLTMAGLEVDGVEPVAAVFSGVVVGEIIACEPHPDADKLRVTKVSTGTDELQVVCGAPNARVGLKVPFARIGAMLPEAFKIKKARLRGVESFGMLCSADELGIEAEASDNGGLMELPVDAPVGMDVRQYLDLEDVKIEISMTPNRADCLSIIGLAREVSANYNTPMEVPAIDNVAPESDRTFVINVEAPESCPRFVGRVIENINASVDSPLWMKQRLLRSGIRSLDPVVDVTNYVMLELGQPMHGYDLDLLSGGICVRHAKADEEIILLNDSGHRLAQDTLLIADHEKPLGLAGIMGGKLSGINNETRNIFLECAFFSPDLLAGKARRYGLHTDASHRFERGVDPQIQHRAIERATALIIEICGGIPGPVTEAVTEQFLPERPQVELRREKITSLLGLCFDDEVVESTLINLGLGCQCVTDGRWLVDVPSWRFDIAIEEDLIEELCRIYGYDKLPEASATREMKRVPIPEAYISMSDLQQVLISRGYNEAINFSLLDPEWQRVFDPEIAPVQLQNPISRDMSVMRTSLLPGLIKTLAYNQKRQQSRVRLFEEGQCFIPSAGVIEQEHRVAAVMFGQRLPEEWSSENKCCDFYDIKGDLEATLHVAGDALSFAFTPGKHDALHPGQAAFIYKHGKLAGHIGAVHPAVLKKFGVKGPVYGFEVLKSALQSGRITVFEPLSKYPEVRRDIAIVVNQDVLCESVIALIKATAGEWLTDVRVFDVYSGQGVSEGQKSFALGLTWRHSSRTLKDDEINELFDNLVTALEDGVKATLRK